MRPFYWLALLVCGTLHALAWASLMVGNVTALSDIIGSAFCLAMLILFGHR